MQITIYALQSYLLGHYCGWANEQSLFMKLCEMARNQKRVNAAEKTTDNEKYAFRCFLLRLGFIGAEYKAARKILLKNLSGSSAFRNGGAQHEIPE